MWQTDWKLFCSEFFFPVWSSSHVSFVCIIQMHYHKMHHFRFDDVKPRMMHLYGIILWCFFCQGGSPNSSGVLLEIQTLLVVSNVVVCMEIHFTVWDQFYSTVCCTHKTRTTNNYQGPAGCLAHVDVCPPDNTVSRWKCVFMRPGG